VPGIQPETVATTFTFHLNSTLTLVCVPAGTPAPFSLGVAADLTGVHPDMLRYYCRVGLLGVDRTGMLREPTFDEDALQEVRRIEHYRRHLAVSRRALPLVCELRREAERRHIEIHFLRCP
jgi:DNA-binding transcriptional MerR regulator